MGLDKILANRGTFNFSSGQCAVGSTYSPNSSDGRKIYVLFNDGGFPLGQWEPTPPMNLNFIPTAIESIQVGGYKKEQLLKIADGVSTTGTELDSTKWRKLLTLISIAPSDGQSIRWNQSLNSGSGDWENYTPTLSSNQLSGASVPAPSDGQSIRWNQSLNSGSGGWENYVPNATGTQLIGASVPSPSDGQSIRWKQTLNSGAGGWESYSPITSAGGNGTVTGVTAGTGLNVGGVAGATISSSGTLNIDVGTTVGKILQVASGNKLPAIDGSNLTQVNAASLQGFSFSFASLSNGQILKYNGTQWINSTPVDNDTLGGLSCSNGRVAYYIGGSWNCLEVNSSNIANSIVARDSSGEASLGSANLGSLKINNGISSAVTLLTPAAFTSYSLKLPSTAGTSGYALVTDGGDPAQLSWSSLSSSQWTTSGSDISYSTGKVGVGTASPTTKLEVAGTIKVGDGGESCSSTTKGSMRYNTSTNALEYCNSSVWVSVQTASCNDATPSTFTFTDDANAATSTVVSSNIASVSGINCSVSVSISGSGSPSFRICSTNNCSTVVQDWTTGPASISNSQYLQIRQTTSSTPGVGQSNTVIVGSYATLWNITTAAGDCSGSPAPGTVCADGTVYAGLSPDGGGTKMYTTRCTAGRTWDGSTCTGTALLLTWNNGTTGGYYTGTSSTTGRANSAAIYALTDGGSPYYAVKYCEELNLNGHTDWYLPAYNEVLLYYNNKNAIGNFVNGFYYSTSTTWLTTQYSTIDVGIGGGAVPQQTTANYVRCARRD